MRHARFVFIAGVLAAGVLAAAGCTGQVAAPGPGAQPAPITLAPPAPEPECNPRASLRPLSTLPEPGRMPAGSTMAGIARRGHLIAGVNQDTQGFSFRDENLRLQGFEIDIVRDIAEAIFGDRERVAFAQLSIADRFDKLKAGRVDLVVATATSTCQRRANLDFSTTYLESGQRVLVNRGSGFIDLASLAGHAVCATRTSTGLAMLEAVTPRVIPVSASAMTDCLALLQLGKVDAVCATNATLATMAAQDPRTEIVGPELTDEPFGVAINKGTSDLVRFVNAVLDRRVQDGRWRASYLRWLTLLGPPPSPPAPQYQD